MKSLVYLCKYDSKECENVIPKVFDDGVIKAENWDICKTCERNGCLGKCCGVVYIKEDNYNGTVSYR